MYTLYLQVGKSPVFLYVHVVIVSVTGVWRYTADCRTCPTPFSTDYFFEKQNPAICGISTSESNVFGVVTCILRLESQNTCSSTTLARKVYLVFTSDTCTLRVQHTGLYLRVSFGQFEAKYT